MDTAFLLDHCTGTPCGCPLRLITLWVPSSFNNLVGALLGNLQRWDKISTEMDSPIKGAGTRHRFNEGRAQGTVSMKGGHKAPPQIKGRAQGADSIKGGHKAPPLRKLAIINFVVGTASLNKFLVLATFHDSPVLHDKDLVGVLDGA